MIGEIIGKTLDIENNKILLEILEYREDGSTVEWLNCWIQPFPESRLQEIFDSFGESGGFKASVDVLSHRVLDFW